MLKKFALTILSSVLLLSNTGQSGSLDPLGKIHIPIGIPDTLDTLKTFVEAEGIFSPGFGTFGIYTWIYDMETNALYSPVQDTIASQRSLLDGSSLIPVITWSAGGLAIEAVVSETTEDATEGKNFITGYQVTVTNSGKDPKQILLYMALRPIGPAGFAVNSLSVSSERDALLVDNHPALIANVQPSYAGVINTDTIGDVASKGGLPKETEVKSASGDCSGCLAYDLVIEPKNQTKLGFICPVLSGRRAASHEWDGVAEWAQSDTAVINPATGGQLQPDLGLSFYRTLNAETIQQNARNYWKNFIGSYEMKLPEDTWNTIFNTIPSHLAMNMNEGAPDVAVINFNVYNRDGMYMANVFQKSGHFDLAAKAIEYMIQHPFSGRSYPEADNPGQILWIIGEQWNFTRDKEWLQKIYPSVTKLANLIEYLRTTPEPHYVDMNSLDFGEIIPVEKRKELPAGKCDGFHPEYTEAFDVAGLRKAYNLSKAMGDFANMEKWSNLSEDHFVAYRRKFENDLPKDYGSYSVLWPCRLYPLQSGMAFDQFKRNGAQAPTDWRYFPLATAHQGLLCGNRDAGFKTIEIHLGQEQMQGWYMLDEGGKSGSGGWDKVRTTWNKDTALPHAWSMAELWLLLRDSLVFEDNNQLVLLSGVPEEWIADKMEFSFKDIPTYFGKLSLSCKAEQNGVSLTLSGAQPAEGFVLLLPKGIKATATSNENKPLEIWEDNRMIIPAGVSGIQLQF